MTHTHDANHEHYILQGVLNGSRRYYVRGEWTDNRDHAERLTRQVAEAHKAISEGLSSRLETDPIMGIEIVDVRQ